MLFQTTGTTEIQFRDENGTAYGVKHVDNKPRVCSMPYTYDIAEGNVPDHEVVSVFGHNANVDTSFETVADTSALLSEMSAAQQLKVVSSSTQDASGSSGANTLTINGLDGTYATLSKTIALGGTGAVTVTGGYLRVFEAHVATAGSSGTNIGDITVTNSGASTTLLQVAAGEGQSHAAIYTAPTGTTLYISQIWASEGTTKGSEVHLFTREPGGVWRSRMLTSVNHSPFSLALAMPIPVSAKTDIQMRAKALQAGANVTAGFEGWYE